MSDSVGKCLRVLSSIPDFNGIGKGWEKVSRIPMAGMDLALPDPACQLSGKFFWIFWKKVLTTGERRGTVYLALRDVEC